MNPPEAPRPEERPEPVPRKRFAWGIFLIALLGPPALAALTSSIENEGETAAWVSLFAGVFGGVTAAVLLGFRIGKDSPMKVIASILLCLFFIPVIVTMSCFGCLAGGYVLSFR
jgi:hypothetical protein